MRKHSFLTKLERYMRDMRLLIVFPVIFLMISFVYLLVLMGKSLVAATGAILNGAHAFEILMFLIDIVDYTLIGVIMLMIIWGVYEIFIADIPVDKEDEAMADQLFIHNVNELKQKLGIVVIISLVVHVFKSALAVHVETVVDLVWMSVVVILLATSLFLIEKINAGMKKRKTDRGE